MDILPPPPRALGSGRLVKKLMTALFLGLVGLGMLGGLGYYSVYLVSGLLEDRDLYEAGVAAVDGTVEGTSKSRRLVFHEYKLTVRYTDKAGKRHTVKQEFDTVFGEVDTNAAVIVHYDAKHPARACCSWAIDVTTSRVLWAALAGLVALVGAPVILESGKLARDAFLERRAAREGREVRLTLIESSRDQYGNVTYAMTADVGPGQVLTGKVALAKRTPWWLGGNSALGVYSEQLRRAFVVEADGAPVQLSDAELAAARERARAAGPASVG